MLNIAIITGRLTADPALRQTERGVPYTRFTLAAGRDRPDKDGGRGVDFLDVEAWRETAKFICRHFRRGQPATVTGRLRSGRYTDARGVQRRFCRVEAREAHFAGAAPQAEDPAPEREEDTIQEESANPDEDFAFLDDDLPF